MRARMNEGLTKQLISHLQGVEFVTRVDIIGSHAGQKSDVYSDVDLVVTIENKAPDLALYALTEGIKETFQPVWYDFANSLMPDKFLVSTFLGGDNPFAFYDVCILNSNNHLHYDKTLFENDQWVHLLKLWVINFKFMMRGAPHFESRFVTMMETANISKPLNYSSTPGSPLLWVPPNNPKTTSD